MLNLGSETIVVLIVLVGTVCGVAGYTIARLGQRRAGGGKTAAELKTELGEYKENVTEHFQETANLLHEMTEQYRSVYEHMAAGAQQLCDPELGTAQIESLRAGLLPVLDTPLANVDDDSAATESELPDAEQVTSEDSLAEEATSAAAAAVEPNLPAEAPTPANDLNDIGSIAATDNSNDGAPAEVPNDADGSATTRA